MDERIIRKNTVKIFEWCKKTFGLSNINGNYPKLFFHRKDGDCSGWYDPWKNEIHVFATKHRSLIGLIGTIIHEFSHYRYHSIKKQYQKMNKIYSYKNHPLEREARKIENKYKWICYNEIFK